jgi:hypothetical protein
MQEWEDDTAELHKRLEEDNDLVEGIVDEVSFPFPGCSTVHVDVTGIYMRVISGTMKRSILGADVIWTSEMEPNTDPLEEDILVDVEEMVNYNTRNVWNIAKCLKMVIWTACRDGLGVMQITWAEEYEPAVDVLIFTNVLEFLQEFPTPEDAGMSPDEYVSLAEQIQAEATEDVPFEITVKFERQTYYGNKGEVVELADFITFPAHVSDIRDESCVGYGKRFTWRRGTIRKKADSGDFYKDAAARLLRKKSGHTVASHTSAKDRIEGLSRSGKDELSLQELTVWFDLEKTGEEQKLLVTYCKEEDELLAAKDYPYRVDFYALFRIEERPGRLIGISIPNKSRDMNMEIDDQHRQRIDARSISMVPSFKADLGIKKEFDPSREENRWRPGIIFWLSDFSKFEQFKVQPTDMGESMAEEANDMRILDLLMGASVALMSGQPNNMDANAPGNKTAMLINQSNLRLDDPLNTLREGVDQVGNICLSHLYQFGPPTLRFYAEGDGGMELRTLHKKFIRRGIKMSMRGLTVADNPDAEMSKAFQTHQMLMAEPLFANNPRLRVESLRDVLRRGRIPNRTRKLPTLEEIQAEQVAIQKAALEQMAMERAQAEAQAAQDAVKQRLAAAKQDMAIKDTAAKTAERALALNGAGNGQPA